ncbi:hypothetical protein SF123566_7937 [Shigella flexneri 1235-66]|nr:hypothetical protein SF123566_7937 [Shigella flexneri 1235-66]
MLWQHSLLGRPRTGLAQKNRSMSGFLWAKKRCKSDFI